RTLRGRLGRASLGKASAGGAGFFSASGCGATVGASGAAEGWGFSSLSQAESERHSQRSGERRTGCATVCTPTVLEPANQAGNPKAPKGEVWAKRPLEIAVGEREDS